MIPDLGRFPRMGYYSGAVFEVYDAAVGEPIASGGYYADLLGRFGMPVGGVGFAIDVDLLARRTSWGRARGNRPMNRFGLTIAVPRGALLSGSLDALDRAAIDTSEVRTNDRKLLFADIGVVTMRPSDVPTYVEAGAADIGITGKDVLMEHPERQIFELADLMLRPLRDGRGV